MTALFEKKPAAEPEDGLASPFARKVLHEMELLEKENMLQEEQKPMQKYYLLREDYPAEWKEIIVGTLSLDEEEVRDDGGDNLDALSAGCDATSGSGICRTLASEEEGDD
ncbi:MAG: hypothetical protein SGPRY_001274 [Prymnesium sp.]